MEDATGMTRSKFVSAIINNSCSRKLHFIWGYYTEQAYQDRHYTRSDRLTEADSTVSFLAPELMIDLSTRYKYGV